MKLHYVIIISLVLSTLSCAKNRNEQNKAVKEFEVGITGSPSLSSWVDFIQDINFIPLETTSEGIINEIQKIIMRDNRIYIQCFGKKGIFIFTSEGKFMKRICTLGKAPFQVNYLFDFSLSPEGILYALDNGRLLTFDRDGNPLKELPFATELKGMGHETNISVFNEDTIYLWHASAGEGSRFHLSRTNIHGEKHEIMIPYSHFSFAAARFVEVGNNEYAITPPSLNDTIYAIVNGKIKLKYILKIKDNNKNIDPLKAQENNDFYSSNQLTQYISNNSITYLNGDIVYNSHYLIFNLHNFSQGVFKRCMINLKTGLVKYFDFPYEPENLFYPRKLYLSYNNKFISSLEAYQVCKLVDEKKTNCSFLNLERKQRLMNTIKNVKETDNPLLMEITLKDIKHEK